MWLRAYRRSIFEHFIFFRARYAEDYGANAEIALKIEKIKIIPDVLYWYVQHPTSAVYQSFSEKKLEGLKVVRHLMDLYGEKYPELMWFLRKDLCWGCTSYLIDYKRSKYSESGQKKIKRLLIHTLREQFPVIRQDRKRMHRFMKTSQRILVKMFYCWPDGAYVVYRIYMTLRHPNEK